MIDRLLRQPSSWPVPPQQTARARDSSAAQQTSTATAGITHNTIEIVSVQLSSQPNRTVCLALAWQAASNRLFPLSAMTNHPCTLQATREPHQIIELPRRFSSLVWADCVCCLNDESREPRNAPTTKACGWTSTGRPKGVAKLVSTGARSACFAGFSLPSSSHAKMPRGMPSPFPRFKLHNHAFSPTTT